MVSLATSASSVSSVPLNRKMIDAAHRGPAPKMGVSAVQDDGSGGCRDVDDGDLAHAKGGGVDVEAVVVGVD